MPKASKYSKADRRAKQQCRRRAVKKAAIKIVATTYSHGGKSQRGSLRSNGLGFTRSNEVAKLGVSAALKWLDRGAAPQTKSGLMYRSTNAAGAGCAGAAPQTKKNPTSKLIGF